MHTKCPHDRIKYNCKDCKGAAYCQHDTLKIYCKECDGRAICIHDKRKYICKECNPTAFCEHELLRKACRQCNSTFLCEHKKQKARCRLCKGSQICSHGRDKQRCVDCGNGSQICLHKKIRQTCFDCHGSDFCIHNNRKNICKECKGNALCEHLVNKYQCARCIGSIYCIHNKQNRDCKDCNGSRLCKSEYCDIRASKKFNGYCMRCCMHLYPEIKISRNYKTKETSVAEFIKSNFPNVSWIIDKRIIDGCSYRRPDMLLDMGSHVIAVEIDENQHNTYDATCENRRIMEISKDLGHRPLIFIRFNPDDYIDISGNKISSCWRNGVTDGICHISKNKKNEWEKRLGYLKTIIESYMHTENTKMINVVHLYYDNIITHV